MRAPLLAIAFAAACQSAAQGGPDAGDAGPENVIFEVMDAGPSAPIGLDSIGSSIHGVATMRDSAGIAIGNPMAVVIMSDRPDLCGRLTGQRGYFRNAHEAYESLIIMTRLGYLGTFVIGRPGDEGTAAEIVVASGPQATTSFHALSGFIALREGSDNGGDARGSFNMLFDDPYSTGVTHHFYGQFKSNPCTTLEGTLLP
jgi:hypothetical protein